MEMDRRSLMRVALDVGKRKIRRSILCVVMFDGQFYTFRIVKDLAKFHQTSSRAPGRAVLETLLFISHGLVPNDGINSLIMFCVASRRSRLQG